MVHISAKFQENTSVRFRVTVRKLNVTDRQTDGGRCNMSCPGPLVRQEIRQTDGRTDGRGRCNISRPGPLTRQEIRQTDGGVAISPVPGLGLGAAGDNKQHFVHTSMNTLNDFETETMT